MPKKVAAEIPVAKTPTSEKSLKKDKARDAKLSIQNNPDGLPWIKNKVIHERHVGKKKTG